MIARGPRKETLRLRPAAPPRRAASVDDVLDARALPRQKASSGSRVWLVPAGEGGHGVGGTIVRADLAEPGVTIVRLDDGRYVLEGELDAPWARAGSFPRQRALVGAEVEVSFDWAFDAPRSRARVVRADAEMPGVMVLEVERLGHVLGSECVVRNRVGVPVVAGPPGRRLLYAAFARFVSWAARRKSTAHLAARLARTLRL